MIPKEQTLTELGTDIDQLTPTSKVLVYCSCERCNEIRLLEYRLALKRKYCNKCKYIVRKERVRICSCCGKIKDRNNSQWCGQLCPNCYRKQWQLETGKVYQHSYSTEQKKQNAERERQYRKNNPEKTKERQLKWRKNNKKYEENRREYYRNYNKYQRTVKQRIKDALRGRLNSALKGNYKSGSAVRDLGCSIEELKVHLESQFQQGMSWDNWGRNGWHIDHIIPLSSFDLTDREQLLKACHYTNLQPLWAEDNLKKSDKMLGR